MLGSWRPMAQRHHRVFWRILHTDTVCMYIYIYPSLSNNSCNIVQNILKRRMLISYELVQINLRAWTHMYIYIYTRYTISNLQPPSTPTPEPHQSSQHRGLLHFSSIHLHGLRWSVPISNDLHMFFSHVFTCLLVFISSKGPNTSKIIQILHQVGTYWHSALHLIAAYQGIS